MLAQSMNEVLMAVLDVKPCRYTYEFMNENEVFTVGVNGCYGCA